jgi:ankyrin repeat protein
VFLAHSGHGDQRRPLEKAAQESDVAEVRRLLASGADPNDRGGMIGSPLNAAAMGRNNVEVIRVLLAAGANPNGRADEGQGCWVAPLWLAAGAGEVENTRALLDAGASLNPSRCSKPSIGWLAIPIVELLVQRGLDLKAVDDKGRNELHLALTSVVPPLESVEYLVRAGVPLNGRDHSGKTPFAYWHEPRDYEAHWFSTWMVERFSSDNFIQQQRERRATITAYLERSGASM